VTGTSEVLCLRSKSRSPAQQVSILDFNNNNFDFDFKIETCCHKIEAYTPTHDTGKRERRTKIQTHCNYW
jgi:hypothetical protein